jgi:AraC-like DNA-binding protein
LSFLQWLTFERRSGRGLLAAFLFSLAITNISILFIWSDKLQLSSFATQWLLPYSLIGSLVLHGPLLFLYVRMLTMESPRLVLTDIWHIVPMAILLLVMLVFSIDTVDLLLRLEHNPPVDAVGIVWSIAKVQPVIYSLACLIMVLRYIRQLRNEYSSVSFSEPVWLLLLTGGFWLNWVWSLLVFLIAKFSSPALANKLGIADNYVTFSLIISLFIYSIMYAQRLLGTTTKASKHSESDSFSPEDLASLINVMEKDLLYLEHNINLERVSERAQISARTVSLIIKKHFNSNFYEHINTYRIEAAKAMLADQKCRHVNILEISMRSGFNSKSAFHRFFDRIVGMSPTAYRKKMAEESVQ